MWAVAAVHVWIAARQPAADQLVLPLASMLCALSLVMMARLVAESGCLRQALWIGRRLAVLLGTLVSCRASAGSGGTGTSAAGLGLLLVLSTFVFGVDPNGSGARLWLGFGGVYFQPSEILKILLVDLLRRLPRRLPRAAHAWPSCGSGRSGCRRCRIWRRCC